MFLSSRKKKIQLFLLYFVQIHTRVLPFDLPLLYPDLLDSACVHSRVNKNKMAMRNCMSNLIYMSMLVWDLKCTFPAFTHWILCISEVHTGSSS